MGLHDVLLKYESCTLYYRGSTLGNKFWFQDKVVLDMSFGIGIFSMFAAKAGAANVKGVDVSAIV